jgi:hypothetical protein
MLNILNKFFKNDLFVSKFWKLERFFKNFVILLYILKVKTSKT